MSILESASDTTTVPEGVPVGLISITPPPNDDSNHSKDQTSTVLESIPNEGVPSSRTGAVQSPSSAFVRLHLSPTTRQRPATSTTPPCLRMALAVAQQVC